jgi:glycosyltransferase involved in cell wall biosynthesis
MLVSVVTASYNSAATIAETIASVQAQRDVQLEHILIDGSSKDATLELARRHGDARLHVHSEPDKGLYDAMNKGLRKARGDVVGFLNSDDVFSDPMCLARIVEGLSRPGVDAVYGDIEFFRGDAPERAVRRWRSTIYRRGDCARGWAPPHPTFYVKRGSLIAAGGFNTSYQIAADFELALRLLDVRGLHAIHIPHTLVRMRLGGASTRSLSAVIHGNREASRACRENGAKGGLRFITRKLAFKLPQLVT